MIRKSVQRFSGKIMRKTKATETSDDETVEQDHPARAFARAEPQGARQRSVRSIGHHQGPSRRREAQHPRTGRARQSGAEYVTPAVGVSFVVIASEAKQSIYPLVAIWI